MCFATREAARKVPVEDQQIQSYAKDRCFLLQDSGNPLTHEDEVWTVAAFSPDGKLLATASREDRTARLWLWQPKDLIAEACARLTRNLTQEEWRQYLGAEPYRETCANLR